MKMVINCIDCKNYKATNVAYGFGICKLTNHRRVDAPFDNNGEFTEICPYERGFNGLIKCGRKYYEVSSEDLIMYNGACYQLILKRGNNFRESNPRVSKKLFKELLENNSIVEIGIDKDNLIQCTYYRFKI